MYIRANDTRSSRSNRDISVVASVLLFGRYPRVTATGLFGMGGGCGSSVA